MRRSRRWRPRRRARAGRRRRRSACARSSARRSRRGSAIQTRTLAGPAAPGPPFDLDTELRPALARIGDKIARLAVELPAPLERDELERRARESLAPLALPDDALLALISTIAGL